MIFMDNFRTNVCEETFKINFEDASKLLEFTEQELGEDYLGETDYYKLLDLIDYIKLRIADKKEKIIYEKTHLNNPKLIKIYNNSITMELMDIQELETILRDIEYMFHCNLKRNMCGYVQKQEDKENAIKRYSVPEITTEDEDMAEYEAYYQNQEDCKQELELCKDFNYAEIESIDATEQDLDNDLLSYVYRKDR